MSVTISHRRVAAGMSVALAATFAVVAHPAGTEAAPKPKVGRLPWSTCFRDVTAELEGPGYECATANVPLDYDQPNGAAIQLALVRIPARDPARRIGSIFLNPGGPGGSGVDFALGFGPAVEFFWGSEVRDRFDIVGFDPRGVGRSTPLRCFGNVKQSSQALSPVAFPLTPEEEQAVINADALLASRCAQRGNKVEDHMSTANVARDLDQLRALVGDAQLSFVGLSYGSFLGTTYANLFPERVRSVVVDGVLDPIAWANVEGEVPFSTRLRSDHGAQTTLEKFFELCDHAAVSADACAFGPDSQARFKALTERLLDEPLVAVDPFTGEPFLQTYSDLIGGVLGALYDPFSYQIMAIYLAAIEAGEPAAAGAALSNLAAANRLVSPRGAPNYPNFAESFAGVACEDGNNPSSYDVWSGQGAAADAAFGYFGRIWTWASSPCAVWPFEDGDRYTGPFDHPTANPVLVIGNLYDPATRYEGATTVAGLLPDSALLTVDVPGHTSLGLNLCAGALTGAYLLDPSVASAIDGHVCEAEFDPFDVAASASSSTAMQRQFRRQLLPLMAFVPSH
jgi:pimeloyl-ACP methyl ester carboxylesterase